MDLTSHDLKRLEEQIFLFKPNIKSAEKKKYVSDRLQDQLLRSKAVVKIQRVDEECQSLMNSLKQRLLDMKDFVIPTNKLLDSPKKQKSLKGDDELKLFVSSDSSDDETLSTIITRQKSQERDISSHKDKENYKGQLAVTSEKSDNFIPLALQREPRERRLSYKSYSSSSTSHSKTSRKKICNQEQCLTTSGVTFSSESILEREIGSTPTLHIKIPSLHRGSVHYLVLDSVNFARKVIDRRANDQQQNDQRSILYNSKTTKSRKNALKCSSDTDLPQLSQQEQELGLSQLIQDVMNEACNDETLQATSALENINNNIIDNYELIENGSFVNYSQSLQEFTFSQNSNVISDPVCSTSEATKKSKKVRKTTKRSNEIKHKEPPKKRGRKPKQRNDSDTIKPQPPTKSNLAKYVELFANDCELLPGSTTPAASSTKSQHLVSSTTHNFEIVDQLQHQQQSSSQSITYYIDGDWANGGPCQLVSSNSLVVEEGQSSTNNNESFPEFVNYIDSGNSPNHNVIATVLDGSHSLPVSIPRSVANFAIQNKNHHHQFTTHQPNHQPTAQNSLLPVINITIPQLPNDISSVEPPPAHAHKGVVDLSIKSKKSVAVVTETYKRSDVPSFDGDDDCMPLDLSACGKYAKEKIPDNNFVTIDTQDEEFIRHLIEQSDFEFRPDGLPKESSNEISFFDHANTKSFKSALDMPLLDFDATELADLVANTEIPSTQVQSILTDNIVCNDSANNIDSNYVSMDAINNSAENNLHFADESTTEIFNKLLDISPENNFFNDDNNKFITGGDLTKCVFDQCTVRNSTMCEDENLTTQTVEENEGYNSNFENDKIGNNTLNDRTSSSTSLTIQLDTSDADMARPLNLKFSCEKYASESEENVKSQGVVGINVEAHENTLQEKQFDANLIETTSEKNDKKAEILTKQQENETNKNTENIINPLSGSLSNNNEMVKNKTTLNDIDPKIVSDNIHQTQQKTNTIKEHAPNKSPQTFQESVVFSVAKTPLSEDSGSIDIDFSSGRSCDSNERKSIEKEPFTDGTESVDKNFICNSEEKFDDAKMNAEQKMADTSNNSEIMQDSNDKAEKIYSTEMNTQQEVPGTSKSFECNQVPMLEIGDILCMDISNQNLTLLELESKLEGSLDFNEDLDDALSLATSCFASPNDERFQDSIVDIDINDMSETFEQVKEPETQHNSTQPKDLKYFKIPKVSNPTDFSSEKIVNKPEPGEMNLCTKSVTLTTIPLNATKITRTVKNDLVQQLKPEANKMLVEKDSVNETTIKEKIFLKVFGITCFPYLVDKCFDIVHCQLSHELNDVEKVFKTLNTLDKIHVNLAYKILCHYSKLFEIYFRVFCTYYTNKNDRTKLLNMVNDCERYPDNGEFIIVINESLIKCGLSRINACRLILKRIREASIATSIVETLIAIIMKADWTMFTDFIEKYTQDMYRFNYRIGILEQMAPAVLNSRTSDLKQVFGKCVQTLHPDDTVLLLNSPTLIQCVALLTTKT